MSKHLDRELNRDTPRPYRIYDATKKRFLLYYTYVHKLNAARAAYWIARWMPVGTVLEVINVRTMALVSVAKIHANGTITFNDVSQLDAGLHVKHTKE